MLDHVRSILITPYNYQLFKVDWGWFTATDLHLSIRQPFLSRAADGASSGTADRPKLGEAHLWRVMTSAVTNLVVATSSIHMALMTRRRHVINCCPLDSFVCF